MLRAPTWTTSTVSAKRSASSTEVISLTTGRPVSAHLGQDRERVVAEALKRERRSARLEAPPRSIDAPPPRRPRPPRVCSEALDRHGPAIRQKVSPPPTRRPSTSKAVGAWWEARSRRACTAVRSGSPDPRRGAPRGPARARPPDRRCSDRRGQLARHHLRVHPGSLEALDHRLDLRRWPPASSRPSRSGPSSPPAVLGLLGGRAAAAARASGLEAREPREPHERAASSRP